MGLENTVRPSGSGSESPRRRVERERGLEKGIILGLGQERKEKRVGKNKKPRACCSLCVSDVSGVPFLR